MLRAIVSNELEKVVRRRWLLIVLVTVAVVGLGLAIELAAPHGLEVADPPADRPTADRQR